MRRHNHATTLSTLVTVAIAATALGACDKDKKEEGASGAASSAASASPANANANAATGSPKIGDSCKGISAADGKIACEGNKIIFCSSYSSYEWKLQRECPAGQSCAVGADGKSASCK